MCGIVGFNWEDKGLLKKMMDSIKHRGPDQSGIFTDKNISLGHQRLSIIDLSNSGKQPIFNEDKTLAIIFNGEIYNYKILKKQLEEKGHKFYTNTDTEVIIHLYEEKGADCLKQLEGMFAFAIYNSKDKSLFLARDRIGIKPLYYYHKDDQFIFASEIKAILEHGIKREINKESLAQYFTHGYTISPNTMFQEIHKLPPSHYLKVSKEAMEIGKYWSLSFKEENKPLSFWKKELFYNLKDSVDSHMMSEVPLGAYLSGGMDSSTIVAYMSMLNDAPVNTFSVGFDSDQVVNELKYAKQVADRFNTNHHEIIVSSEDAIKALPKIAWHLDEPINNPASVPLYYMSKAAKKEMTVVLTGNGGDEIFAGYRQHKIIYYADRLKHIPLIDSKLVSNALGLSSKLLGGKYGKYLRFGKGFLPKLKNTADAYSELMYKNFNQLDIQSLMGYQYNPANKISSFFNMKTNMLNKLTAIDIRFMLPEDYLMVDDKINMANGIESRVPFLDSRLVDYANTMPQSLKLNWGSGKFILKEAMKGILPKEVISRKKYGFTPPVTHWIDRDMMNYTKDILGISDVDKYLDRAFLQNILNKAEDKQHYNKIFPLMMFGQWYDKYMN